VRSGTFLAYAVLGGLIGTFFISNGQDVSVWITCAARSAAGGCHGRSDLILDAKMVGIATAGFLSILVATLAGRRGKTPAVTALALIIGVLGVSLLQILKAGVGNGAFPEIAKLRAALYIWATSGFLIVVPALGALVGWSTRTIFRLYGWIVLALVVAMLCVALLFTIPEWFTTRLSGWGTTGYLHAYAIVGTVVVWAVLLGSIWSAEPGQEPFVLWAQFGVSALALLLSFGYGALIGVTSSSLYAADAARPWLAGGLGSLLLIGVPLVFATLFCLSLLRRRTGPHRTAVFAVGMLGVTLAAAASVRLGGQRFIDGLPIGGDRIVIGQSALAFGLICIGLSCSGPLLRRLEARTRQG
jgi:hypothetical protein